MDVPSKIASATLTLVLKRRFEVRRAHLRTDASLSFRPSARALHFASLGTSFRDAFADLGLSYEEATGDPAQETMLFAGERWVEALRKWIMSRY